MAFGPATSGRNDAGQGKRNDSRSTSHFLFPHLPVHGFGSSPRDGHFLGDLGPHVCLVPGDIVSLLVGFFG